METNFSYPLNPEWNKDEIATVAQMLNLVADAYEVGVKTEDVTRAYQLFKKVVVAKSEEKQIGRDFERETGYSLYRVVKTAQQSSAKRFMMK